MKAFTTVLPARLLKKNTKSVVRQELLPISDYRLPITIIDISYSLHNSLSFFLTQINSKNTTT
ncbi:hypothetical protein [Anabaena sp. UHCC 0253]|uniref:hypothetical protein n=1 Tax=Anabaena sp. UHCC 0253 TaxID=2590019 RepID=UPI001C2C6A69|nr:hypothetical protein [Anabaena sp. UHCC 0253]